MPALKKYENTGSYLHALYNAMIANLDKRLAEKGYAAITPSHALVYENLDDAGARITSLAASVGITKQSMSALINKLEADGIVKRHSDPQDARAVLFRLTARGRTLRRKARRLNYQYEQKWAQKLGVKEYLRFKEMVSKLVDEPTTDLNVDL